MGFVTFEPPNTDRGVVRKNKNNQKDYSSGSSKQNYNTPMIKNSVKLSEFQPYRQPSKTGVTSPAYDSITSTENSTKPKNLYQ